VTNVLEIGTQMLLAMHITSAHISRQSFALLEIAAKNRKGSQNGLLSLFVELCSIHYSAAISRPTKRFLPRDAMRERAISRRPLSVCHTAVLYPNC